MAEDVASMDLTTAQMSHRAECMRARSRDAKHLEASLTEFIVASNSSGAAATATVTNTLDHDLGTNNY